MGIRGWVDKEDVMYTLTHVMEYYSATAKMKYCHLWHDGSWKYHAKWGKSDGKNKNYIISLIRGTENKKEQMN